MLDADGSVTRANRAAAQMLGRPATDLVGGVLPPAFGALPNDGRTAEIITPAEELLALYENGTGSVKMRAVWEKENGEVVITALPHQVSPATNAPERSSCIATAP